MKIYQVGAAEIAWTMLLAGLLASSGSMALAPRPEGSPVVVRAGALLKAVGASVQHLQIWPKPLG